MTADAEKLEASCASCGIRGRCSLTEGKDDCCGQYTPDTLVEENAKLRRELATLRAFLGQAVWSREFAKKIAVRNGAKAGYYVLAERLDHMFADARKVFDLVAETEKERAKEVP